MKICAFKAETALIDSKTSEYRDPLMKWPLRGAAFTNEVGEALRPLIGQYATLTWVPALMYIGADIYDKYKNDQTEYSPNSKRLLKQAIFQGTASILLPIAAVKLGQNMFSFFGMLGKDGIAINKKERIGKFAEEFIANGQMRAYQGKDEECIRAFMDKVQNNLDFEKRRKAINNPFLKVFMRTEDSLKHRTEKINKYAESTIKDLIKNRKLMLNPTEEYKSTKFYRDYINALSNEQTKSVAAQNALTNFQQNKMLKGKVVKTIGGFIVLGLLIKPIDKFVHEILIGKILGPTIDNIKKPENPRKKESV